MTILGIDPGYAITGYGVVRYEVGRFTVLDYGAATTPAKTDFSSRLELVYDQIGLVMKKWKPDALSIEQLFFTTNATTAIGVAEARGVILLAAKQNDIPVFEYTPLQVKSAVVGYGKAEKSQVMEMTRILLRLQKVPKPDDTADALAIAICHAHSNGSLISKLKGRY